ncbi:MAG: hypothetical protein AAFS12_00950 [Cyanobacteria bacterium J06632_19]
MAIIKSEHGEHQHVYGGVDPSGGMMFGEGFKSRKIKDGTYLIEFERPFRANPAPVCTIFGHEWRTFDKSVALVDVSPQHFICVTSSPNYPEDSGFTFVAFGDV